MEWVPRDQQALFSRLDADSLSPGDSVNVNGFTLAAPAHTVQRQSPHPGLPLEAINHIRGEPSEFSLRFNLLASREPRSQAIRNLGQDRGCGLTPGVGRPYGFGPTLLSSRGLGAVLADAPYYPQALPFDGRPLIIPAQYHHLLRQGHISRMGLVDMLFAPKTWDKFSAAGSEAHSRRNFGRKRRRIR